MTMLINFGFLGLGLVMLYFGAEWLVKGSSQLALKAGISPLVVGLTVVAFGTSAPELAVSIDASLTGDCGFAFGNVIGSNICNFALVLGVAALIKPLAIHRQVVSFEMPFLIGVSALFMFFLMNDSDMTTVSRWEGAVLTVGIVSYVAFSLYKSKTRPAAAAEAELEGLDREHIEAARNASGVKLLFFIGLIVVGLFMLVKGADLLVHGSKEIAVWLGVPSTLIGLSIVAFGTSLPELATSIVATVRGHGDIITGNAVGSCIFNLLAVIGIASLVTPISTDELQRTDLYIMMGLTLLMFPFMASKRSISRVEGFLLTAGYIGYVVYLANTY